MLLYQMQSENGYRRQVSSSGFLVIYLLICHSFSNVINGAESDAQNLPGQGGVGASMYLNYYTSGTDNVSLDASHSLPTNICAGGRTRITNWSGSIIDGPGNYSTNLMCTWLIDSGRNGTPILLSFQQLATECAWDHLYVYDGDSAFAPAVAAFSGLVRKSGYERNLHEIVTGSGKTYIHFYSDAAFFMSGFNITYKVNVSCPAQCATHGACQAGVCRCQAGWTGADCTTEVCPNRCNGGRCDLTLQKCVCPSHFHGADCSVPLGRGSWRRLDWGHSAYGGLAAHATVAFGGFLYSFGGYKFRHGTSLEIVRYNVQTRDYAVLPALGEVPTARYGASVVIYKDEFYVFGGDAEPGGGPVADFYVFSLITDQWQALSTSVDQQPGTLPLAVSGHTAHVVGDVMYVIFGYSDRFGAIPHVQKYNFVQHSWSRSSANGANVQGAFGAASAYDARTNIIYVHGGYRPSGEKMDKLYAFDVATETWRTLRNQGQPRHLHTAFIVDGLMLVYGGNTDSDANFSTGSECYSGQLVAYDTMCDRWLTLDEADLGYTARYGHTATFYNQSVYVFGGFNGELLNDVIVYEPGVCSERSNMTDCLDAYPGVVCAWSGNNGCVRLSSAVVQSSNTSVKFATCPADNGNLAEECNRISTCSNCLSSSFDCNWCTLGCTYGNCPSNDLATENGGCPVRVVERDLCAAQTKCEACHLLNSCIWSIEKGLCQYLSGDVVPQQNGSTSLTLQCPPSCATYGDCYSCSSNRCLWCGSERRCVDSDSYLASFPFGQCMEWTMRSYMCAVSECALINQCSECMLHPRCGWCEDGSGSGVGMCLDGADSGPTNATACPVATRWRFTTCPACQCNGHSTCAPLSDLCFSCTNNTNGTHCEYCKDGYWGTAVNAGSCSACECGAHAQTCDRLTGNCLCTTQGVIGNHCDRCNTAKKYYGNAKTGTCYYFLQTDYEIRFNYSSIEERFISSANFMNIPPSDDRDLDFYINCSKPAYFNVTVKTIDSTEDYVVIENELCSEYTNRFSYAQFSFGSKKNTTVYVYLYDFETPIQVTIRFTQFLKIDLFNFFITFFGCFLSLLLVAALFWKIKQRYDIYQRRQRVLIEMEWMIRRPFANVLVKIGDGAGASGPEAGHACAPSGRSAQHAQPAGVLSQSAVVLQPAGVITVEPLRDSHLAVISVFMEMPLGGGYYPPPNQSGLVIASTVTSIGHIKLDMKVQESPKRKAGHTLDACI